MYLVTHFFIQLLNDWVRYSGIISLFYIDSLVRTSTRVICLWITISIVLYFCCCVQTVRATQNKCFGNSVYLAFFLFKLTTWVKLKIIFAFLQSSEFLVWHSAHISTRILMFKNNEWIWRSLKSFSSSALFFSKCLLCSDRIVAAQCFFPLCM